jgi:hypothetical protein
MHTLFEHFFLHVQMLVRNAIVLKEVENDLQLPLDFRKVEALARIMCSFCNVSQSLVMYQWKWAQVSWWPFSPLCGGKDKQQEMKNSNACQTKMSNGSMAIRTKRIHKTC